MKKLLPLLVFLFAVLNIYGQSGHEKVYNSIQEAMQDSATARSLDLSEKNLTELPIEILRLKNLEDIDLEANPNLDFDKVLHLLSQLKNLKTLGLGRNKLSNIPKSISELSTLTYLSLEGNEFTQIPESVKKLKITTLYLFDNKIRKLDLKIGDLPRLENINLCYNKFKIFPAELSILPNLKQIVIWYNDIEVIPRQIKEVKKLEYLDLDHNKVSKMPSEFSTLKSLHKLRLTHNRFTSISIKPIYKLKQIDTLEIDQNNISEISGIVKLKQLIFLDVSDNPLTNLPSAFSSLNQLGGLALNDLHRLDWHKTFLTLSQIPMLKTLGMASTGTKLYPDDFIKLTQLGHLWLKGNSFSKEDKMGIRKMLPNTKIEF